MTTKINPKLKNTLNTGGGMWSVTKKKVAVTKMEVHVWMHAEDIFPPQYGELRVFFNRKTWNTKKLGLIYTDILFLKELQEWIKSLKIKGYLDYSEQGMQGANYVSLDIDQKFLSCWAKQNFKIVKSIY